MNIIDSYQFGLVVVNGKSYTSDVVIFPDRVKDNWRRKTSHQLRLDELSEAIAEVPEVLIVGTGAAGLVKVLPEVKQIYNQLCHSQRVVAALHLTC